MSARGVNPRNYDNSRRAEQARATRRRIIDVARELLLTQGYASTTIAQVAQAVAAADLILAPNAQFDRRFAELICPAFVTKPWACSMAQVSIQSGRLSGARFWKKNSPSVPSG